MTNEAHVMNGRRSIGGKNGTTPYPNVQDALVPVLTRRTHYKADAAKLQQKAEFQFWLRALPIQFAAILYALATGATVMGLCKLLGEKLRCC